MGLSETIVAAMIGAGATIPTALFQLFSSLKARNKVDVKPRKGSTTRSVLAVLALMLASAVGGFLYSELLRQSDAEELRAMRQELRELKELAATRAPVPEPEPSVPEDDSTLAADSAEGPQSVESVAYVPPCRRTSDGSLAARCTEDDAQRIALCGSIPAHARVYSIDLFAQPDAVQNPWEQHRAELDEDLGGARFMGRSFEYAQGSDHKAVCVNFLQWSGEHSHIARIVVNYGFGEPFIEQSAEAAPAAAGSESLPAVPNKPAS